MRKKVKPTNDDILSLGQSIRNNDTFIMFPGRLLPRLGDDLAPPNLVAQLDSMTVGLSADHMFICLSRIDPFDAPNMINNDVYVCGYDTSTQTIAPTGWMVHGGGGEWHHQDPAYEVGRDITYNMLGLLDNPLRTKGPWLSKTLKRLVDDSFRLM
ncbi:MAG: hypothetical protein EA401_14450 [Planctomycetota bacterium]|nr:MAG: hypothetical protein EA401_14450 [Planctomycetota bacterium]